jgi:hypothetical protein
VIAGGIGAMVQRLPPRVSIPVTVADTANFLLIVFSILLEPSPLGIPPQQFQHQAYWDQDLNIWEFRNVDTGPDGKCFPRGIKITSSDKTIVMEFGDEFPNESGFALTPITVVADKVMQNPSTPGVPSGRRVRWHSLRTPEGSSLWRWHDYQGNGTGEKYIMCFRDDESLRHSLDTYQRLAAPLEFAITQN